MSHATDSRAWWDLHLRKARGDTLSESEERLYGLELARQDREALPLMCDLDTLRQLRSQALNLAQANSDLRRRLVDLDEEIRIVEKSLSQETREEFGVKG